nr:tetratricopeptide repeat protein [Deinobacterium chartae]
MRQVLESVPPEQLTPTARLLQAHALVQTGGTPRTVALLDPLPASARSDARLWLVQCILAARRGQSAALLELAQQGLALPGSPPHIVSALQLYQASALVDCGHEEQGAALARELIGYAAGGLTAQLAGLTLLQGLHARRGEWTEHDHLLERRLELSEQAGLRHAWVHARIDRIARCRVLGRLDEAARLWEAARQAVEQTGGASEVFLHELRGELQLAQHRPQEALEAFQHASELCQHFGHHRILGRVLLGRAETQLRLGNLEAAQESLLLAQATPAAGARWFQHALNFVSGLLALEADRAERAAEHLRQVGHASSDPTHRPRAQALLAELDARAGHLERASLQGIFAELDRLGSDFALTLDRPQLSRLLQLCAQRDWYVARLSGIGPHTALRAPLLHLRTLGSLEVSIDGVPVRLPLAKGGELLAWLALHGQASREQLVNALWDGCNATRHHEYCRVAIRRLRVALSAAGQLDFNPLPFDGHSYRIAPQFRVTLDLEALRAAEQTPQQPEALEAALKAYRGPFLPEAETEWAEVLRSQLEASALRLALHLGDSLLPSDPRRAAAAFERALALDPLTAEAYLGLCRAHLQSGNRLAARAVHDEYRRHLGWDDPRGDLERALLELLRS